MSRHAALTAAFAPRLWAALAPPRATLEVSVVVPVRSEAARLPATLAALAAQVGADGRPFGFDRFEIIVLANNCTDASAQIVRRFAARHPGLNLHVAEVTFPEPKAHVGHARACLMDEACRRLHSVGRLDGIVASTDGDTCVAPDWLAAIVQAIRGGADAVGGRIEMNDDSPLPAGLARLAQRDADYQHLRNRLEHVLDPNPADPWPRHHQHFGASLALTVAAYLRVGGLPPRPFLEDEALWQALLTHDMRLRHCDKVRVVTSNRRRGRVAVGLSWQLREWSALASSDVDADAMVDDPARLAHDLRLRRNLRDCWAASRTAADASTLQVASKRPTEVADLAAALQVPARWLRDRMRSSETFGKLWLAVAARRPPDTGAPADTRMPMRDAIAALRAMLVSADGPAPHEDGTGPGDPADPDDTTAVSGVRRGRADSALAASR